MLQIGEKFPNYSVTATISIDKDEAKAFTTITEESFPGKWKVYFFWPRTLPSSVRPRLLLLVS